MLIPYSRQNIFQEDIDAVIKVLRSNFLTQGNQVPMFEEKVAHYCGANGAVAVNSATSALHIACLALDLGTGDWLWTSPNTFVASANCGLYCGAKIDFVDIDPKTNNISIDKLKRKLEKAKIEDKLPKIVIAVHFSGQPCQMEEIYFLSIKYRFKIIEDASHAIGASYSRSFVNKNEIDVTQTMDNQIKVGSCYHSDITVFSFHPVKIITTGEGGMALSNDPVLIDRMRRLRTHGITNDKKLFQHRPVNEIWNYQQLELGFNYRMSDIEAALGLSQMERLDEFVRNRNDIAKKYDMSFNGLPIVIPYQLHGTYSSYHLYSIRIRDAYNSNSQRKIYDALWRNGVAANLHYIPVHRHPFYERQGFRKGDFPEAEKFHREAISIPIYPGFSEESQQKVINILIDELEL